MTSIELENLENLLNTLKEYNKIVYNHSMLVRDLSLEIGKKLKLSLRELDLLLIGSMFHDIGKIKVPKKILEKQSDLKDIERTIIRNHVTTGVSIISDICESSEILDIVGLHHMNEDGSGYKALTVDKNLRYNELVKIVHASNILANNFNKKESAKTAKNRLKEAIDNNNIVNINIQKFILTDIDRIYDIMKNYKESNESISKLLGV